MDPIHSMIDPLGCKTDIDEVRKMYVVAKRPPA